MMSDRGKGYPDYTAYPEYKIVDISCINGNRKIQLISPDGQRINIKVSLVAVLIGSRPDLNYLPPDFQDGKKLGVSINFFRKFYFKMNFLDTRIWPKLFKVKIF